MAKRGGLGTNLDALIPLTVDNIEVGSQDQIDINLIDPNPRQPRTVFDPDALQELVAALGKGVPEYQITESGPDHDKSFSASAVIAGEVIAEGSGKSKREAEQSAARSAFEILRSQSE